MQNTHRTHGHTNHGRNHDTTNRTRNHHHTNHGVNLTTHDLVTIQDHLEVLTKGMQGKGGQMRIENSVVILTPTNGTVAIAETHEGITMLAENVVAAETGHEVTEAQRAVIAKSFKVTNIDVQGIAFRTPSRVTNAHEAAKNNGFKVDFARLVATQLLAIWPELSIVTVPTFYRLKKTTFRLLGTSELRSGVQLFSKRALTHLGIGGIIIAPLTESARPKTIPTKPTPWAMAELTNTTTAKTTTKREPVGARN